MALIKAGIFLKDRIFAEALAEGLSRQAGPIRFYLLSAFEEGDFCDLILAEPDWDRDEGVFGGSDRESSYCGIVELVRQPGEENLFGKPPYRIYRYKESPNLLNDLLFVYFEMTGRSLENHGDAKCRTIVFLSECGGCGATSIALASARMLYQIYGSRVLYLNLCPLNDTEDDKAGRESGRFVKLLYYLQENRDFPVSSFITEEEELDCVNTGIVNGYFNEMKPLFMQRFLEKIGRLGKYDFLFLDIGNHLSRENKNLISGAECTVLVSDGERRCSGKYRKAISREIAERVDHGRIVHIRNFADDSWEEDYTDETELAEGEELFCISRQRDGNLQLAQNFGNEVSEVAKAIMEGTDHGGGKQSFSAGTD